jgi:hypothetical protein
MLSNPFGGAGGQDARADTRQMNPRRRDQKTGEKSSANTARLEILVLVIVGLVIPTILVWVATGV